MNNKRTNTPFTIRSKDPNSKKLSKFSKPSNDYSNNSLINQGNNQNSSVSTNVKPYLRNSQHPQPAVTIVGLNNADENIRRSTSFKSKQIQQHKVLGCTYYPKEPDFANSVSNQNDISLSKPKSASRKKRIVSMHKTTAAWSQSNSNNLQSLNNQSVNNNDYSYDTSSSSAYGVEPNIIKTKNRAVLQKNAPHPQKPKMSLAENLPKIPRKERQKFVPDPITEKRDEYIRYILKKKRNKRMEAPNGRNSRAKNRNLDRKDDVFTVTTNSARRESKDTPTSINNSNTIDNTHSFNLGGINFEVHSKKGASPNDSVEHLKSYVMKDMSLMFYDFNGAGKRLASESPPPKDYSTSKRKLNAESMLKLIYQNKTSDKFFQRKTRPVNISKKTQSNASTHDATISEKTCNSMKHSMIEDDSNDGSLSSERSENSYQSNAKMNIIKISNNENNKRSKSPPGLAPFTNNSIFFYFRLIIKKVTEKLKNIIIAQQKTKQSGIFIVKIKK